MLQLAYGDCLPMESISFLLPYRSNFHLICWHQICSVLTTNKNLRELQVSDSTLHRSASVTLCSQLKHPRCHLQKLQ